MSNEKDFYAVLGVSPDADAATIEEAYERAAHEVQPDVNAEPADPERMRELDEAFDVLDDPERRAEYDQGRSAGSADEPPGAEWAARASIAGASAADSEAAAEADTPGEAPAESVAEPPRRRLDRGLVAGILLVLGGLAAVVAAVALLVFALTDDDGGDGTEGFTTTDSGLAYKDGVEGTGASPQSGQVVTVHYTGTLDDGTEFDSSVERGPFAFTQDAGSVIPGWEEGVVGMQVGGQRTLVIPPELAYGAEGQPPTIPANATLTFDIELLAVSDVPPETVPEVGGEEIELESGLVAIDVQEGSGDVVETGDTVFLHYTGYLEEGGTRFDSSLPAAQVVNFQIGESPIPGLDIGLPGMKEGGKRRLIMPPELGFGAEGAGEGAVPPNARLIFDIELIEVQKPTG